MDVKQGDAWSRLSLCDSDGRIQHRVIYTLGVGSWLYLNLQENMQNTTTCIILTTKSVSVLRFAI